MNLFSEYRIKNINIKNRIVLPPMVRFSVLDNSGYVNTSLIEYYEKLAKDGNGLIIVEATCVCKDGKLRENQLGIWDDSFIEGLSQIAKVCKKYNVPSIIQLHHVGFKWNISEIPEEVLDNILEKFIEAFYRAKKCGFDGIEIHGAHTYLISQLSNSRINTRKDKYGGRTHFERLFFSRELIRRTKDLFDDNFILAYRLGANEPLLEDGIKLAKILEKEGVDLLDISTGIAQEGVRSHIKVQVPEDFNLNWVVYMASVIKKQVNLPIICVNQIKTEKDASYIIENQLADFVAIGRAQLGKDFSWPERALKNYLKRKNIIDI